MPLTCGEEGVPKTLVPARQGAVRLIRRVYTVPPNRLVTNENVIQLKSILT